MTSVRHKPGRHLLLTTAFAFVLASIAGCGNGGNGPPVTITEQESVALGDFNNDGRLDLAVSTAHVSGAFSLPGEVDVFLQDPANPGTFFLQTAYGVGNDPFHIASADLNGDGRLDLAVANTTSDSVSVLLNDPLHPGTFFPAVDFPCGTAPLAVATGDLSGDGLPDIAVAVADGIDILFQNPITPGTFFSPAHLALPGGTFSTTISDLDGDGRNDIAAVGLDAVHVFFQDPVNLGAFSVPASFSAGLQPNAVVIADINRDGRPDMVVANIGSPGDNSGATVSVLLRDPVAARNFLTATNFATRNGAHDLAVSDLDGDGLPDIVVASVVLQSQNAGIVSVLLQNSAVPGTFTSFTYPDGFTPKSVAIGDLNNDGKPDIAIQDGPAILFQDPLQAGTFFNEVLVGP